MCRLMMCFTSCWRASKDELTLSQPQLVNFRKLGSVRNSGGTFDERKDKVRPPLENGKDGLEHQEDGSHQEYQMKVVGGVVQKVPLHAESPAQSPSSVMMRKHKRHAARRRVSCKDLGRGECQGWLYKKKEKSGIVGGWGKRWFVLKNRNLYYYKDQNDEKAQGVLYLPAFQVSPAPEKSKKKQAFKAHHAGTTFYFASDSQEDMRKWMNKMGLAAISYDTKDSAPIAAFVSPTHSEGATYSESDDDDASETCSLDWESVSEVGSLKKMYKKSYGLQKGQEDLHAMVKNIRRKGVTIDGRSQRDRRTSHLSRIEELPILNKGYVKSSKKLASLHRTLKDKVSDLSVIDRLLSEEKIDSEMLRNFLAGNPKIVTGSEPTNNRNSSSEESLSDSAVESLSKASSPSKDGSVKGESSSRGEEDMSPDSHGSPYKRESKV